MPKFRGNLFNGGMDSKTVKGEKKGYFTFICYLAPANESGLKKSLCSHASPACLEACLFKAGRGNFNSVQQARIRKARLFIQDREAFMAQMKADILKGLEFCARHDYKPCFRPNGTSDIPYERIEAQCFNGTMFDWIARENLESALEIYDYTKIPIRYRKSAPSFYRLVYSYNELPDSEANSLEALSSGFNVATVFRKALPEKFLGFPVINGDESDLRFLDPIPSIVGLMAKGSAKRDTSGFVIDCA